MDAIRWGTVGEWAAFVGAAAAIATTLLLRHLDHVRAERQRILERASKVNVWFQAPNTPPENASEWLMVVENRSELPLNDWEAAVWWFRQGAPGGGIHTETRAMSASTTGPLRPEGKFVQEIRRQDPHHGDVFPQAPARDMRAAITWRDPSDDRWWLRLGAQLLDARSRWPLPWAVGPDQPGLPDPDQLAQRAIRGTLPRRKLWRRRSSPD